MGKQCVVWGCNNRDSDKLPGVKFHRIPKEEPRRSLWLQAINRKDPKTGKDWVPDKGARICSEHFKEGKSDDPSSPDYVPSVNMGYEKRGATTPAASMARYERVASRSHQKELRDSKRRLDLFEEQSRHTAAEALLDISSLDYSEQENTIEHKDTPHDSCIKMLADANVEKKQLLRELERLQLENTELKEQDSQPHPLRATYLESGNQDEKTTFFTGLPSYKCFLWLVSFVSSALPKSDVFSPGDLVLLVLMKLRLNSPHADLAYRFGVSRSHISNMLDTCIPQLADKLKFFVRWPAPEDLKRNQPQCFRETYPKCVSVIDCTEVFIECPSSFSSRSATYSNYKHTNTIKYLVSITPCGSISFLSRAFGGRTSDKVITLQSGYLDNLVHGGDVLADRGFLVRDEVNSRGAELIIPSFTKGKDQLSAKDVETSRRISRVRIHVERMMERLKNFRIFSTRMPLNMVSHADSIMTICAAIVNMHPKLVQ